jgi:hypothetical protein
VDGAGVRASRDAAGYVTWLIFLEGLPFLAYIFARRGATAAHYFLRSWQRGIAGGAASLAAYGIVLWAMTRAPVAAVAALREVSVLFAALMGAAGVEGRVRLAAHGRRCQCTSRVLPR